MKNYVSAKITNCDYDPRKYVDLKLRKFNDRYYWILNKSYVNRTAFLLFEEVNEEIGFKTIKEAQTALKNYCELKYQLKHSWKETSKKGEK